MQVVVPRELHDTSTGSHRLLMSARMLRRAPNVRHAPHRRRLSLLTALAVVAVGAGCDTAPVVQGVADRLASPEGAAVHVDFGNTAALPPSFTTVERARNAYPLGVVDGRLEHGAPTGANAASYLSKDMSPQSVRRIGATAVFDDGAAGSIALLVSAGSVPTSESQPAPDAAVHFVADRRGWTYAVWEAGSSGQTVLERGSFGDQLDLRDARFEVELDGNRAKVYLPDSTSVTITDERISRFGGTWATWELFESDEGMKPASFRDVWVS